MRQPPATSRSSKPRGRSLPLAQVLGGESAQVLFNVRGAHAEDIGKIGRG